MAYVTRLDDRGVLHFSGADTIAFLDGLLTNDVAEQSNDGQPTASFAGLLTPQGKILFDFLLVRAGDDILIDCPRDQAADLAKRLNFYKLRAAVKIDDLSDSHRVIACWGDDITLPPNENGVVAYVDPRDPALGIRWIVPLDDVARRVAASNATSSSPDGYDARRIALGVAEIGKDYAPATIYPHEANYDLVHGVSFTKGCYVGQEVVSRMHHKAVVRNRIVPVTANTELVSGIDLTVGDVVIGRVGSVSGKHALAQIRLDRASDAIDHQNSICAGQTNITINEAAFERYRQALAAKTTARTS